MILPNTFAARPVGAISSNGNSISAAILQKDRIKDVLPVPAKPFISNTGLKSSVIKNSDSF